MIDKRKRFFISSILLSSGFVIIQSLQNQQAKFLGIGILSLFSIVLFYWSLKEALGFNASLLVLIMPLYFTAGVGLFWFLLPANLFTKIIILVFYSIGIYVFCLTSNIFTVSALRTIALYRAAKGVGFLLTLLSLFLVVDSILSLRLVYYLNALLVFLTSFPLFLQGFWTSVLTNKVDFKLLQFSLISSLVLAQTSTMIFFWPVSVVVGSLFLTITTYVVLALGQSRLEERLFSQTIREYLSVGIVVLIVMFLSTRWGA
ncbi:MAG TPA: hypothetical protein VI819_00790 [Patescibacteria group bacterium]|nr:hypothetical protein [Patescibacteria group bacterium]